MLIEIEDRNTWLETLATSLKAPYVEGQDEFSFNNELGKGTFYSFEIEEGIIVRNVNFALSQEILFKEQAAKKKGSLIINFTFQGYPKGTVIVEHPHEVIEKEKQVLIYSDNSTIIGRFPEGLPWMFTQISVSFEWLKRNYIEFINKYPKVDVGLDTPRSFFAKQSYKLSHQKSLEQLMFTEYPDEIKRPVYKGLVLIIVADILNQLLKTYGSRSKYTFDYKIQHELDDLEEYIKNNLDQEITIEMLCKKIGYSKTKLHNLFKSYFNFSMYDYIKHLRLVKAKSLLLTTDLPISDISIRVGYQSIPHFTNRFKKEFGVTPVQYRKGYGTDFLQKG